MSNHSAYFDNHASTPCDQRVLDAMIPFFVEHYANAASITHSSGQIANTAVSTARRQVANFINARSDQLIFTSSATESNNLAILGSFEEEPKSETRGLIASSIEHKSILEPMKVLGRRGISTEIVPVDEYGKVRLDELERLLSDSPTRLVSIQAANNEVGTIQDVPSVSAIVHRYGAALHCDATQAVGRINVDVEAWQADFVSFSAHKLYGPKGIAALFVRDGANTPKLTPLMYGGEQEGGLRPGTLNVPGIVGFGEACGILVSTMENEIEKIESVRDLFEHTLLELRKDIRINGSINSRLPGNSNLSLSVDAEALVARLSGFAISTGSACSSGSLEPSPVLLAMGRSRDDCYKSLRVGFGRFSTLRDAERLADAIAEQVNAIERTI